MSRPENELERQRLAAMYAAMSEEELRSATADSARLTDEAIQSLYEEVHRRRLELPIAAPPVSRDEVGLRDLVTIAVFRDLPEAVLAQGMLESAGIESVLNDDNLVRMDWFYSNAVGGVKLKVSPQDVEAANELLSQPRPEAFAVEGVGDYQQPRCPKCQSMDISFEEIDKTTSYFTAWLRFPIPVHLKDWRCHTCGAKWEDGNPPGEVRPEVS